MRYQKHAMCDIGGLPGSYDDWRQREPEEAYSDDPDCTCTTRRMDKFCAVHGKDPDDALDELREREWERQWEDRDREIGDDC